MADARKIMTTTKEPYVRVITDKRREQNRTSQKRYRERLRKRLEELEDQVASTTTETTHAESRTVPESDTGPVSRNRGPQLESQRPPAAHTASDSRYPPISSRDRSNFGLEDIFHAAGDIVLPQGIASPAPTFQVAFLNHNTAPFPPGVVAPQSQASVEDLPESSSKLKAEPIDPEILMPNPDPDSLDLRHFWPMPAKAASYTLPPVSPIPLGNSSLPFSPVRLATSTYLQTVHTPLHYHGTSSPFPLPDPYLNYLQLTGESTFNATFAIAASLGISISAYLNDHPSLFYHSTVGDFSHLPCSLRPTPAQLTLPHPVYIDCIVFPAFRTRAVILSARGELDHVALFLDLMLDGLVCWGDAGAQLGRGMEDRVPWSTRSWEAQCWFLRRWEALVGTDEVKDDGVLDEDGMWEGSRWWKTMRGECYWMPEV